MSRVEPVSPIYRVWNHLFGNPFLEKKTVTKKEETKKKEVTAGVIITISTREERYPVFLETMTKQYFDKLRPLYGKEELHKSYQEEKQRIQEECLNDEELFEVSLEAIEKVYKILKN